jgi:hypothetical protein
MPFYPILKAPHTKGFTTLYNFPPNNWEVRNKTPQIISLTYLKNNIWHTVELEQLNFGEICTISYDDIASIVPDKALPLLSLSKSILPNASKVLPNLDCPITIFPVWRATLGLSSQHSKTSYQGEINPFPPQASLLTFPPLLQFGKGTENYVLLLNIEQRAAHRMTMVEIYDSNSKKLLTTKSVTNNQINIISLDNLGFNKASLPVVICRDMAFIPLYFSISENGDFLSLEHTHPPASIVVHGQRFGVQKYLKEYWFSRLKKL